MNRSQTAAKRKQAKRLDALLALPLDRYRRALADLTPEELAALEARLALQRVKSRWERSGHGVARHRSSLTLALLSRRETALRQERAARLTAAPAPINLVLREISIAELAAAEVLQDQAA